MRLLLTFLNREDSKAQKVSIVHEFRAMGVEQVFVRDLQCSQALELNQVLGNCTVCRGISNNSVRSQAVCQPVILGS